MMMTMTMTMDDDDNDDDDADDDANMQKTHRAITLPWRAKDLNIPDSTNAEEPVLYTEIDSGVRKNNQLFSPVKYFTLNVRGSTTAPRLGSRKSVVDPGEEEHLAIGKVWCSQLPHPLNGNQDLIPPVPEAEYNYQNKNP